MTLNVKQAAGRAGGSPGMVYQWCAERRLPHFRAGGKGRRGRIVIDESDLSSFVGTLKVGAAAEAPPPLGLKFIKLR